MKRRDKYNLLSDPVEAQQKADKDRERGKEYGKKRAKGTGKINRSFHLRKEDL